MHGLPEEYDFDEDMNNSVNVASQQRQAGIQPSSASTTASKRKVAPDNPYNQCFDDDEDENSGVPDYI